MQFQTNNTMIKRTSILSRFIFLEIKKDLLLYATILIYYLFGLGLFALLGNGESFSPLLYVNLWLIGLVNTVSLYIVCWEIPCAMKRGSEHPFRDAIKSLSRLPIPRLVAGNLLFCGVAVFYGTFTSIKTLLPALIPFNFDVTLAGWDDALHAGVAPWRLFHPILGNYIATRMIEILYGSVWIMLLFAVPAIFAMHPKLAHLRQRFFMTFFLVWIGLGNVLAAWGMSAGPAFYGAITGDATRYADLLSLLSATRGSLQSAADYQDYLWSSYVTGKLHFGTGISAFPSMHVALATLYTLAAVAVDKWLGAVFVLFWAIILVGSVHLAWHYAIDGYVSTLGTIVIWLAVSGCQALAGRIRSTASRPLIPQGA